MPFNARPIYTRQMHDSERAEYEAKIAALTDLLQEKEERIATLERLLAQARRWAVN